MSADSRRPLFVPLTAQAYGWWVSGRKHWEVRRWAPRWHKEHVHPGRRVTLARGYGWPRLEGTVGAVWIGPLSAVSSLGCHHRPTIDAIAPGATSLAEVVAAAALRDADDWVTAFEVSGLTEIGRPQEVRLQ